MAKKSRKKQKVIETRPQKQVETHQKKQVETPQIVHGGKRSGWFVILLAAAGIGICLYLYSLHVALLLGEIKSGPLCGADGGLGCQSVASGPYSSMMGLPLASWGALFYSALALLGFGGVIFWRDCGRVYLRWAFYLAVFGFAFDLYLAYTMVFRIQAVCWLCVTTYVINVVIILVLVKSVWKEPKPRAPLRAIFPGAKDAQGIDLYYRNAIKGLLIGGILLASVVGVAGSQFISKSLTGDDRVRLAKIKENLTRLKPITVGIKNRPFKGSANAAVTVVEFSDFLCPFCAKAAKYLKLAESGNHDTARFVFRHYPLDKSCNRNLRSDVHPGACLLAEGSVCADEQNKFWEYHDIAFETKGKISRSVVMDIASNIGLDSSAFKSCLNSGQGLRVVSEDINAAAKAGVNSTPTLFVNGRKLRGVPKPWVLNEILEYSQKNLFPPS
jgi:protein-disulfide isomerase/uncharacterized membrane protein